MTFTWQAGRQLATLQKGTTGVNYTYGSDGTRLTKTVNGVKTSYTWDGAQLVSQTTTGGDTLYFTYHGNSRVAVEYKGNTYYYIYNLQGDVVGLVNSSGTSVVSYTYDAWGNPESITGSMASTLGAANPFRYRGYYYDTESGLYYLMSRYYDPVVGRFLNADGILAANGDLLSFNLFTYCSNNPTNLADPAGDIAISTIILIGAVVGGLIAEGFSPENRERANNLINDPNPYNVGNWLTLGAFDTVKGAVQPEEPLSAQHWLDSAATATMIMVPASKLAASDPFQGLKNKLFKTPAAPPSKTQLISSINNEVSGLPRIGSALKSDAYHAFPNIVDNYVGYATKSPIHNGMLYQLPGSLNGVAGRFEWIVQNQQVTHRMFVPGGGINGIPIMP